MQICSEHMDAKRCDKRSSTMTKAFPFTM